jgi:hypothetical protein
MMGIDGAHGVYHAEQDGIFAVLSDVSLKEYSETALDKNMTDMAWLVPRAKRHEEVIEFVMTHATLNQNVISNSPFHPHLNLPSVETGFKPVSTMDRGRKRFSPPLVGGVRACPVPDMGGGGELLHPISNFFGLFMLVFGASMFIFGWRRDSLFIATLSLLPVLYGLISCLYGLKLTKVLFFPILYLILLAPPFY